VGLAVVSLTAITGRVQRVLYRVRARTACQGVLNRFFSPEPKGRYLILDVKGATQISRSPQVQAVAAKGVVEYVNVDGQYVVPDSPTSQ
jgi:hypothetical protein